MANIPRLRAVFTHECVDAAISGGILAIYYKPPEVPYCCYKLVTKVSRTVKSTSHDEQFLCWHCFQRQFWNLVLSVATEDIPFLRASALSGPILWACVAYQFVAESLLLLDVSTSQKQHFQLTVAPLAGQKFDKLTYWKGSILWRCHVESHRALQKGHSTANVCLWRLHGCVLKFIVLSATGLAEIAESTNLKGCPHSFVYIVY